MTAYTVQDKLRSDAGIDFRWVIREQDWRLFWIKLLGGSALTVVLTVMAAFLGDCRVSGFWRNAPVCDTHDSRSGNQGTGWPDS